MPTWGDLLGELKALQQQGHPAPFDLLRRRYLTQLSEHTGRNTIFYSTKWTQPTGLPPEFVSITEEDVHGLMEVVHGLKGSSLDLLIHSPGGSPDATGAIVSYLRSKFVDIRVIVPQAAMSAATMLACAANRIVMGRQSSLGPIDPQMILNTPLGPQAVPAQAILDQFAKAQQECRDPALLGSWLPMLGQYGPALLVQCEHALSLSRQLVGEWLANYMFAGHPDRSDKARRLADALADHRNFKSHGRHIDRSQAKKLGGVGLVVEDLEADQRFQDLVLSAFHATMHTFNGTPAVKIMENNLGRAFIKRAGTIVAAPAPDSQRKAPQGGTENAEPLVPSGPLSPITRS